MQICTLSPFDNMGPKCSMDSQVKKERKKESKRRRSEAHQRALAEAALLEEVLCCTHAAFDSSHALVVSVRYSSVRK
jgi:hypothetical protein